MKQMKWMNRILTWEELDMQSNMQDKDSLIRSAILIINLIILKMIREAGVPQLVNEYGWIWLWRNGQPSKLTVDIYNYYLGPNSTAEQNREFQAYLLQLETEWLRSEPADCRCTCILLSGK